MILIVGLGNPEEKYERTWHNLGFRVLDALQAAQAPALDAWHYKSRLHSDISEGTINGQRVVLAKPRTYMNRSGTAVGALLRTHHLGPDELWVVHDEVDLPLGRHKVSADASAAGHKGVQSIIESLGTQGFARFRLGIATNRLEKISTDAYVLMSPEVGDEATVDAMIERTVAVLAQAVSSSLQAVMTSYNAPTN